MKIYIGFSVLAMMFVSGMAANVTKYLETMSKEDLMKILACVSPSKNQALCDEFIGCVNLNTKKVLDAYTKCNNELNPEPENTKCDETHDLYPPGVDAQIYDCIGINTVTLTDEEMKIEGDFENCARNLNKKCLDYKAGNP